MFIQVSLIGTLMTFRFILILEFKQHINSLNLFLGKVFHLTVIYTRLIRYLCEEFKHFRLPVFLHALPVDTYVLPRLYLTTQERGRG